MSSGDMERVHGVEVRAVVDVGDTAHDALVVLQGDGLTIPCTLQHALDVLATLDAANDQRTNVVSCEEAAGGRLVVSHLGPLSEYDDVRSVGEAAAAGVRRALAAGARRPALLLSPHPRWSQAPLVALLAALEALYVPLQEREAGVGARAQALGVVAGDVPQDLRLLLRDACALERARGLARDIGGADPERMCPLQVAAHVRDVFAGSSVHVRVLDERAQLKQEYPLLAAVDRGSIDRHRGCVIMLEYEPKSYERTVMLVGKGVTYDTGGNDLKVGGAMSGMSYDKCGAAAVAGFLALCDALKPPLKVVAALGVVRNAIGAGAYVADEVLTARSGARVLIGNTDAEGRLVMADLLHQMAQRAANETLPHLYTVATLTGHVVRAYGAGYTGAMDNHAARGSGGHAGALRAAGEPLGDMLEVSTLRREDLRAHSGGPGGALRQAAPAPSVSLPRGHQGPAAFLLLASGLDKGPVPYTHLDVAGSGGHHPDQPTGAPIVALAAYYRMLASLA